MGLGYAELAQERDIAEAVQSSRIEAQFQPIVELSSGRMLGYEALARWRRTDNELVAPQGFLPLAERTGLIRDIDFVMARQAMCFAGTLADRSDGPYVNINFSARHFHDPDDIGLATRLTKMLSVTRLDAHRVHIELTESLMIKDPAAAERQLKELSAHGFKIALDDFGTGYSSLSVLHRMPIDILKIDCSLVRDIANSTRARSVLRSIVGVASDLGMEVVAEGIEDEATLHALLELGCHRGQGFHFAAPLHARDILARRNAMAEQQPLNPAAEVGRAGSAPL